MARSYEEFHEQNKNELKEEFNARRQDALPTNVEQPKNHIQKRIDQAITEITEERYSPKPTPDFVSGDDLNMDSIHRAAIRRVQQEMISEKKEWIEDMEKTKEQETKITQNSENQQVDVSVTEAAVAQQTETLESDQSLGETEQEAERSKTFKVFKTQVHQIINETQTRRAEASRTFIQNRGELLKEAEAQGAENPAQEVSKAQRQVHKAINADEHKQMHTLFQEHGWDYDKQGVEFVQENETISQEAKQEHNVDQAIAHEQSYGESQ